MDTASISPGVDFASVYFVWVLENLKTASNVSNSSCHYHWCCADFISYSTRAFIFEMIDKIAQDFFSLSRYLWVREMHPMSRNFSKRKSFKMTVLQHELKYLLISFQQTSVTSIKLSERVKLTKHVFSSLTSGQKFFQGTTMSVFRSCVVLALLRIKEIPMHHSASLSLLPFRFLVVGSVYIHWIFILGAKRIYKGDQQRVSQRHATVVHVKEP